MTDGPRPGEAAWDAFYADWIAPLVHLATPALAVLAALLVATRILTRFVVGPEAIGTSSRDRFPYQPWRFAYWLALLGLAVASVELTVGIALARGEHLHRAARVLTWTGAAVAAGLSVLLLVLVLRSTRTSEAAEPATASGAAAALAAFVLAAVSVAVPHDWSAPAAAGVVLAVVGTVVAARVRGLEIGLVIDATDELSASVRTRLHAIGSAPPAGIQLTQTTDVSSLPDDAITLLPDGTLRKAVTVLANLVTPATPWRLALTELDDGSVTVILQRNGRVAATTVVRRAQLALPPLAADAAQTAVTRAPVRIGAAAFVLLELAKRHPQLSIGLCGATRWRSVAQQLVAVDPATADPVPLLSSAVALDPRNATARNALLVARYSSATEAEPLAAFVAGLARVEAEMRDADGWRALLLRVRFNLAAANLNLVRALDASHAVVALDRARTATNDLLEQLALPATTSGELAGLAGEIAPAAWILAAIVARESDPSAPVPEIEPTSLLGHYERACLRVLTGDTRGALADLELAATNGRLREYAREDRWLVALQDSLQFKKIVGDPVPKTLFELDLFADVRAALRDRGVVTIDGFRALTPDWLHAELGATPALASRWREVAELAAIADPGGRGWLHVLVTSGISTRAELRRRLADPVELRGQLVDAARPYAVVAPAANDLARWVTALGAP